MFVSIKGTHECRVPLASIPDWRVAFVGAIAPYAELLPGDAAAPSPDRTVLDVLSFPLSVSPLSTPSLTSANLLLAAPCCPRARADARSGAGGEGKRAESGSKSG